MSSRKRVGWPTAKPALPTSNQCHNMLMLILPRIANEKPVRERPNASCRSTVSPDTRLSRIAATIDCSTSLMMPEKFWRLDQDWKMQAECRSRCGGCDEEPDGIQRDLEQQWLKVCGLLQELSSESDDESIFAGEKGASRKMENGWLAARRKVSNGGRSLRVRLADGFRA